MLKDKCRMILNNIRLAKTLKGVGFLNALSDIESQIKSLHSELNKDKNQIVARRGFEQRIRY